MIPLSVLDLVPIREGSGVSEALEETRIVEVYISNIRRKLRSICDVDFILNFRGRGLKLVLPDR